MPKTREDQIVDLVRTEIAEYRSVIERHGVARVTIVVDYDYKTDEPYNVDVLVNRRRSLIAREVPRTGFVIDRRSRTG